jgi:FMN reductase
VGRYKILIKVGTITPMSQTIIFSTSLNAQSRSRVLAREALTRLHGAGQSATFCDLQEMPLPLYGMPISEAETQYLAQIKTEVTVATHILFAVPIYNFDASGAGKNLIEYLGESEIAGKTVGFLCAAGGKSSYMSVMSFANSLMLDFRCWIVPRFVYAVGSDFDGDTIKNPEISNRLDQLLTEMFACGV